MVRQDPAILLDGPMLRLRETALRQLSTLFLYLFRCKTVPLSLYSNTNGLENPWAQDSNPSPTHLQLVIDESKANQCPCDRVPSRHPTLPEQNPTIASGSASTKLTETIECSRQPITVPSKTRTRYNRCEELGKSPPRSIVQSLLRSRKPTLTEKNLTTYTVAASKDIIESVEWFRQTIVTSLINNSQPKFGPNYNHPPKIKLNHQLY